MASARTDRASRTQRARKLGLDVAIPDGDVGVTGPAGHADRDHAAVLFDAAFVSHATRIALRAETAADATFLEDLAVACSPLAGMLPDPLIRRQAVLQRVGYEAAYPEAMRRIATCAGHPAGRLLIDWAPRVSRCVDIALLPAFRGNGAGTALLASWLTTAERLGMAATLSVTRGNPAIALYRRLGLVETHDDGGPILTMARVP